MILLAILAVIIILIIVFRVEIKDILHTIFAVL